MKLMRFMLCFLLGLVGLAGLKFNVAAWAQSDSQSPVSIALKLEPSVIKAGGKGSAILTVIIEKGYHIFSLTPDSGIVGTNFMLEPQDGFIYGSLKVHPPIKKFLKALEKEVELYENKVVFAREIRVIKSAFSGKRTIKGKFRYQACSDTICLLPKTITVHGVIEIAKNSAQESVSSLTNIDAIPLDRTGKKLGGKDDKNTGEKNIVESLFKERGNLLGFILIFFSGLALNLTPCIYPMIPVTASIFLQQSEKGIKNTLFLALLYILGLATTYSALGTFASLTGQLFGSFIQNTSISILLSFVFIILALSMFGFYELRLPSWVTNALASQKKGVFGVFLMGSVVGIIAAPCIGPFVLALLIYVGELANPVIGFLLFFAFSIGLGLPYLFLAVFSSQMRNLPKAGEWLIGVKKLFGVVMIFLALNYLRGVIPEKILLLIIGLYILGIALVWGFQRNAKPLIVRRVGGIVLTIIASVTLAASISMFFENRISGKMFIKETISWQTNLEAARDEARHKRKPMLIDFYSLIWCPACIEFERVTYKDPRVIEEMKKFVTIKIDVDKNPLAQELMKKYDIRGIPTIVFIDSNGKELISRVVGFQGPNEFLENLIKAHETFSRNISIMRNISFIRSIPFIVTSSVSFQPLNVFKKFSLTKKAYAVNLASSDETKSANPAPTNATTNKKECQTYWATLRVPGEAKQNGYEIEGFEFGVGISYDEKGNRKLTNKRQKELLFTSGEQGVILVHINVQADNIALKYQLKVLPKDENIPPLMLIEKQGRILKRGLRTAWFKTKPLQPGCAIIYVFGPGEVLLFSSKFLVR